MKFELWRIDSHPGHNTRELVKTYNEEDLLAAESEAYNDFIETVLHTDTSHEDKTIYRCDNFITYELRAAEED